MIAKQGGLSIEPAGIADILHRWRLSVPLNQRPYAWEDYDVEKLFQDLLKAFNKQPLYFLGTVMFTHGDKSRIEVADGQQRLATISMLIAAIRDFLIELGDADGASQYQSDFLIKYDPPSGSYKPRLTLNVQDDDYFHNYVLLPPDKRQQLNKGVYSSHERIEDAACIAAEHVRNITAGLAAADKVRRLYEWIDYLKETALVIVVNVPAEVGNSFKMFETLNARGVPASQVDILKNFIFDKAPDEATRIHSHWLSMLATIEAHGNDDLVLTYIRHLWVSQHGPTTLDDLGDSIENFITNERRALELVALLDDAADDYVALLTPLQNPRWEGLSSEARQAVDIITNEFRAEQIRPLMLAVARQFGSEEIEKAFKLFLSWSVRFLIVGGGGGGKLDRYYGTTAKDVTDRKITSTEQLVDAMNGVIPRDKPFREEFLRASVKKANLARYYLRAIESFRAEERHPQFLLNEDPNAVNLEHILPVTPSEEWDIDAESASVFHKRLGNMVLLGSRQNVALGHKGFREKKAVYGESKIGITNEVAAFEKWGPDEIKERQAKLADDAPNVWPITWK